MIPEEKVRQVAERTSVYEVVSEYVQLRRAGINFVGLCPFHAEKTPSFNVNPARETFHCFGCGAGGNVFSFIMKIEGVGFPEAVKMLARKAGIEIEDRHLTPAEKQQQDEREIFYRINLLTAEFYSSILKQQPEGKQARNYLAERSADGSIADTYGLGFAPDKGDALARHLRANGIDPELALKLGVLRKSERGWYDQFRNRLMFPIRDVKGKVIAFAGRVLDASLPKYINSPESPLYHKSSILFGMDMALPAVRQENSLIIVEGYFDHLALFRADIRNVAATCGTALTAAHAAMIKRHAARVYLLFDGDSAGRKATVRAMETFLEQQLPAYVITLPNGEDPDSFLSKNSVDAFKADVEKARPAFDYFLRSLLQVIPADSVDNKVRAMNEIIPRFRKITSPIERDLYEKEICRLLGITAHAFRKQSGGHKLSEAELQPAQRHTMQKGDARQETLLTLLWSYPEARARVVEAGIENLFDGDYLLLARLMLEMHSDQDNIWQLNRLTESLESPELKMLLSRLLVSDAHLADVDWRVVFENCRKGQEQKEVGSIKEIAARLAVVEPDSKEYADLLRQADSLRSRKSKL